MIASKDDSFNTLLDPRFQSGLDLFNSEQWYLAHDVFEDLWHETNGPERITLQGLLQVAVAQVHLEGGNKVGAMILYGEGLGRLSDEYSPDLGLDLKTLCECVEKRLKILQVNGNLTNCSVPVLLKRSFQ